jgi:hypothetical protein
MDLWAWCTVSTLTFVSISTSVSSPTFGPWELEVLRESRDRRYIGWVDVLMGSVRLPRMDSAFRLFLFHLTFGEALGIVFLFIFRGLLAFLKMSTLDYHSSPSVSRGLSESLL